MPLELVHRVYLNDQQLPALRQKSIQFFQFLAKNVAVDRKGIVCKRRKLENMITFAGPVTAERDRKIFCPNWISLFI